MSETSKQSNEMAYFDTLKELASFQSPELLQKISQKTYGVEYHEALEMAYENMIAIAGQAVRNKRRPRAK